MPELIGVVTPHNAKNKSVSEHSVTVMVFASRCVCMRVNILQWLLANSGLGPLQKQQGLLTLGFVLKPLFFCQAAALSVVCCWPL